MKKFYLLSFVFILAGCVTTNTTGFVDPDYRESGYEISRVVIQVNGATMEETQIAEQKLSEKFNAHNVQAIKFTDIVPPTREYTPKKTASLIKKTGAESLFSIYIGKDKIESYVPVTYHAGTTTSSVNTVGNYSYVTTNTTPGYTSGGYSTSEPVMTSISSLTDLSKNRLVWKAEGQAVADSSLSLTEITFADLLVSTGIDAINDLVDKGILPEVIKEKPVKRQEPAIEKN
tara:strand:+ start:2758 stop:3450 length:693 start_codon:yes stop_codon:yes gene_type:complete